MAPRWIASADRHEIPRPDQIYAISHATYQTRLIGESLDDGEVLLFIGYAHPQTNREIEILVNVYEDGREAVVFHAMELGPKFRRLREEDPDGIR